MSEGDEEGAGFVDALIPRIPPLIHARIQHLPIPLEHAAGACGGGCSGVKGLGNEGLRVPEPRQRPERVGIEACPVPGVVLLVD